MSYAEMHIVETYSKLFEGLSTISKLELIERLSKSIKKEKLSKKDTFFDSFGAFGSEKSAEEIISEIKASRKFKDRELKF